MTRFGRTALLGSALAASLALGLLVSACGGSSGPAVAEIGSTATKAAAAATTQEQALLGFARCMRRHGVAGFPDPKQNPDGTYGFADLNALRRLVRAGQPALTACEPVLAKAGLASAQNLARFQQQMLVFAKCMRTSGVPGFPDPGANGRFGGRLKSLDRSSPAFQKALTACRPELTSALEVFSVGGGG